MTNINMASIMAKVQSFATSKAGKQKTSAIIKKYRDSGKDKTDGGSEVLTKARMIELADELINILKTTAESFDLPESVMAHFKNLDYIFRDDGNDNFACLIYFADDLSRESLETDESQGDGIDNIIALFNNGYVASAPKYGWWNGHMPKREALARSVTGCEPYAYVRSVEARPSLHFMQSAINDFYNTYAKKYDINVILNTDYDGNYKGSLNGVISKM